MSQDDFYQPSYYGQSHSSPTTEKWFDSVPRCSTVEPLSAADIEPMRPNPAPPAIDIGHLPSGATVIPFVPTGCLGEWKRRWE